MKTLTLTRKIIFALVILLGLAGIYPVSYQICPNWSVTVVDTSGAPVPGMTVSRSCNDYSTRSIGNEDDAITDERGRVTFAEKRIRASIFRRWVGNVVSFVRQGVEASYGRHSSVFAYSDVSALGWRLDGSPVVNGYVEDWTGEPEKMESRIVAKPVQLPPVFRPAPRQDKSE
jgi:hypothetical protein